MALTAAEKQRLYRARRDVNPEKRAAYLEKERLAWQRKVTAGKVQRIDQLSARSQRQVRKKWRVAQQNHRKKEKTLSIVMLSPSSSLASPSSSDHVPSRQKLQSWKQVQNRQKTKSYRDLCEVHKQLHVQKKLTEKYKKRYYRMTKAKLTPEKISDTPRTKTRKLLKHFVVPDRVRKTLDFHHALSSDVRQSYEDSTSERVKQRLSKLFTGKIIRKYRMLAWAQSYIGFTYKRCGKYSGSRGSLENFERKKKCNTVRDTLHVAINDFFLRDDNSRLTSGKKETITRNKTKKQKRFLNDSILNVHKKFLSDFPNSKVSYSLFCMMRPFWVVPPSLDDRETCLCKTHENLSYMVDKLYGINILRTKSADRLADSICCNPASISCAYDVCKDCRFRNVPEFNTFEQNELIKCTQWRTVAEPLANGQTVNITKRVEETSTKQDLFEKFTNSLHKFKRHQFNIRHQFSACRELRLKLMPHECIVHIDFAENYSCKYSSEIQAVHFGASHQQVTLHTGVLYVGAVDKPIPFCTVSPSRRHDPVAIWVYLEPLFDYMQRSHSALEVVHFYSDGPTTQYRQKVNFFLFCTKIFDYGYSSATWNFWEASHGKGAPDGIGATIKRSADRFVSQGKDIPDALTLFTSLNSELSVKLFYVDCMAVEQALVPANLPVVNGTMKLHQLITVQRLTFDYRDVSCFCSKDQRLLCSCYEPKTFSFPRTSDVTSTGLTTVSSSKDDVRDDTLLERRQASNTEHEIQLDENLTSNLIVGENEELIPIIECIDNLLDKWCVVRYDNKIYPGIITDTEESDIEVRCMSSSGDNRFYWPIREDLCWYTADNVLYCIPEPQKIGSRHVQIKPMLWEIIKELVNN